MARLEAVQPGETLARQALPRLRSAILEGHYAPGEHLGEVALSRQLGISRGPLREALQHLIREGLVERVPRRGVFVRSFDARAMRDLSGARTAIEVQALREAITDAPDAAFAPLQAQLDEAATVLDAGGAYPVTLDLDRAEPLLRQHIARSVERLSAAPVLG